MVNLSLLKADALARNIPILRPQSLALLVSILQTNNLQTVLEIGSAIGYTALYLANLGFKVTSIEKDKARYHEALANKKKYHLAVNFLLGDGCIYQIKNNFDLIFIDASKGHYQTFFTNFETNLKAKGIFFIDNIDFATNKQKRFKTIAKRMHTFWTWLNNNPAYEVTYYPIEDGILVARKK